MIRTGEDRHRFVLTNHHIVMDGWSLPILLREIFASYYGQRLPPPVPYRRFVTWLAGRDRDAPARPGVRCWPVSTPPPWWARQAGWGWGARAVASFRVPEQTTRAVGELARSCHTTVNIVLQAAYAQLLCRLTGQHDVVFGTTVSGRPAEVPGADSMVGLLINTVPVRAHITAATTTADLLDQLHNAHNHTLDHQHLALSEIHRITGHDQLFDTLFVVRELPDRHRRSCRASTGWPSPSSANREYNHYPLAVPGPARQRTGPSRRIRHRRVRRGRHRDADRALHAGVGGDDRRPDPALSSMDVLDDAEHARLDGWGNRAVLTQPAPTPVSIPALFAAQVAARPGGGGDQLRGAFVDLSRSSMRPRTGWRTCWPTTVWARASGWRCCCPARPRRSWRSWRC